MTEVEAKTKWCPFVRFHMNEGGMFSGMRASIVTSRVQGFSRADDNPEGRAKLEAAVHCIASKCMAWRQFGEQGHCGLAGPSSR